MGSTFHSLHYHWVCSTKVRRPFIRTDWRPRFHEYLAGTIRGLEGVPLKVGGVEDHAHLAVSIPPKIAPAKFIGDVKGNSSHFVNHVIKPDFEFYWQDEYGVLSFGEKNLPTVVRYIHNQKQHHAEGTLIAAMERIDDG